MAKHERVKNGKNGDADQRHHNKRQDSQPLFDQSLARDSGSLSLTETPFHPRMDEHAAILSSIPFSAQRHEFIIRLHQTYGNRYVQHLVESVRAQAKLNVSNPNDVYEQEADRVAETVTGTINSQVRRQEEEEPVQMKVSLLQRQEEEKELQAQRQEEEEELAMQPVEEEEEEEVQAKSAEGQPDTVSESIEARINHARGSGYPLSDKVREPMQQAIGADFSGVRVHTDSEANVLNQELSAKAFTTGKDIFFRQGEYSPGSNSGQRLISHELTHVVQQSDGLSLGTELVQRMGSWDPDDPCIEKTDPGNIGEIQWGRGTEIKFTGVSSCLVLIGQTEKDLIGVHLSLTDDKSKYVYGVNLDLFKLLLESILAECSKIYLVGETTAWTDKFQPYLGAVGEFTRLIYSNSGQFSAKLALDDVAPEVVPEDWDPDEHDTIHIMDAGALCWPMVY
ncbi:DUF4157 domain-containing protein [Chloroflexota bacterium]